MSVMLTDPKSPWRLFPLALIASLLVVVAVNVFMAWTAISGFPGKAVENEFGVSNRYDQVLAQADRQAALGWRVNASIDGALPGITLVGADGKPLEGARISAVTGRPVGPPQTIEHGFHAVAPGRYVSDAPLGQLGNWDMMLRIEAAGQTMAATRRIVLR